MLYLSNIHNDNIDKMAENKKTNNNEFIAGLEVDFSSEISLSDYFKKINSDAKYTKINSFLYKTKGYILCIGASANMQDTISNLSLANSCGLTSAPKLVKVVYNKNKSYCMLVYELPNELRQYNHNDNDIDSRNKMTFFSEMINFSKKTGYCNPAALDSENWLLNQDKKIIVPDWSELNELKTNSDFGNFYKKLAQKLNLVLY